MNAALASFDPTAPGAAASAVLCGARVGGMVLVAPVFSSSVVPKLVRAGLVVTLTVLLVPVAFAARRGAVNLTPSTLAAESLIGLAIGLGAAVLVAAAETAGDVMAVQVGLSGSAILNPLDMSQVPVLGMFGQLFAITVLLSFNLHHDMLRAVADSLATLPVGTPVSMTGGLSALVELGGALFTFGVRFAAPVIAVVLLTNLAMAVLGRAAPQLNLLSVSFPVQIAIGLFVLSAALPAMARTLAGGMSWYHDSLVHISGGFTAVPR